LVNNAQTLESFPVNAASHNIVAKKARGKPAFCRVTLASAVRDQSARFGEIGQKRIMQNSLPTPPSVSAQNHAALQYEST
jgi:hypothetical protein